MLANNWFPSSSASLVGCGGAGLGTDSAKPELVSAHLEYPARHATGRNTPSILSSLPTSQITRLPAIEQDAGADLWLGTSSVSVYDDDICFGPSPNSQDDQTWATNGSRDTWSLRATNTPFPDQHLPPHEPLLGLSPIPLLDPTLEEQESWAPIQRGDVELAPFLMPSFPPALFPDLDTSSSSKPCLDSSTVRDGSSLKKRPENDAGRLHSLDPLPAPAELSGPARTPRKRRRRRYDEHERSETRITRMIGGCIACRSRRKRVRPASLRHTIPRDELTKLTVRPAVQANIRRSQGALRILFDGLPQTPVHPREDYRLQPLPKDQQQPVRGRPPAHGPRFRKLLPRQDLGRGGEPRVRVRTGPRQDPPSSSPAVSPPEAICGGAD